MIGAEVLFLDFITDNLLSDTNPGIVVHTSSLVNVFQLCWTSERVVCTDVFAG